MINTGSEFTGRETLAVVEGYRLLDAYTLGDVISYDVVDRELDDLAWQSICGLLLEVAGEGYRYIDELDHWVQLDSNGVRRRIRTPYGYDHRDYWTQHGSYLGPDKHGIEPVMCR